MVVATLFKYHENQWLCENDTLAKDFSDYVLVLCFGSKESFINHDIFTGLKSIFTKAEITMCSTAGEIYQNTVFSNSLIAVALKFNRTTIATSSVNISNFNNSNEAAQVLLGNLKKEQLNYIMVLSDGSLVNGSELTAGLRAAAGNVLVTGGFAGDNDKFESTLLGLNCAPTTGNIVAIGFYGDNLLVTHGSNGGWDMFGLARLVTKSNGNVLHEINGECALDLYKKYLGPDAESLPSSALLFPLSVSSGNSEPIVRTILSIDEINKTMTFAGDIPEGSKVRLMKANFDKLIDAAAKAAENTLNTQKVPDFSLLISCVGRKLILGPRTEEEVEAVADTFNNQTPIAGFYAYGEISPFNNQVNCQLHNQTMTITSFYELP